LADNNLIFFGFRKGEKLNAEKTKSNEKNMELHTKFDNFAIIAYIRFIA